MHLLVFIIGLVIGSFLNVCIYRIPKKQSICYPSSHCIKCNIKIKWYDNIPLISYAILQGKCRYCKENIDLQYPIVEILNGILYLILFYHYKFTISFIFHGLITSILLVVFFIDFQEMIIPDILVVTIIVLEIFHKFILYFTTSAKVNLLDSVIGLLVAGMIFMFIILFSKGQMGSGDMTLISALGFILGLKYILLTIFLSFFIGAILSLLLLLFGVKSRKDFIPFSPFIILGFFIVLLYGESIINLYIELII